MKLICLKVGVVAVLSDLSITIHLTLSLSSLLSGCLMSTMIPMIY